jgi:phage-related minor tail protein
VSTIGTLKAILTLDSKGFNSGMAQAKQQATGFSGAIGKVAAAGAALVAAEGVKKVVEGIGQIGETWEVVGQTIQKQTGATGAALEELTKDAEDIFASVPVSAQDAGAAMAIVTARTKDTGKAAYNTAKAIAEMSVVSGTDIKTVGDEATQMFNSWQIGAKNQVGSLDTITVASQKYGVSTDTLQTQLSQYQPILKSMNLNFDQSANFMGRLDKAGVNTSTVMTGLGFSVKYFAKENIPATKGIADTYAQIKKLGPGTAATALAIKVFGRNGVEMANDITSGKLSLDDLQASLGNTKGALSKTETDTLSLGQKFQLLKNRVEVALIPLGEGMLNALNSLMPLFTAMTNTLVTIIDAFSKLPGPVQTSVLGLFALVTVAGVMLTVFAKVKKSVDGIIEVFTKQSEAAEVAAASTEDAAVASEGAAVAEESAWLAMLGPIALVLAAVVFFAVAYEKNWLGIRDKTNAVVKPIVGYFKLLASYFKLVATTGTTSTKMLAGLPKPLKAILSVLGLVIGSVERFIQAWKTAGSLAAFKTIPKDIAAIGTAFKNFFDSIGLSNFGAAIQKEFDDVAAIFRDVINVIDDLVHGRWAQVWIDLQNLVHDAFSLVIDYVMSGFALLEDLFNLAVSALSSIPWSTIGTAIIAGLTLAIAAIPGIVSQLIAMGGQLIQGLLSGAKAFLTGTLIPWVATIGALILAALPGFAGLLLAKGAEILGSLLSGITGFFTSDLAPWLVGIGALILSVMPDVSQTLKSAGKSLLQGLRDGIDIVWGNLSDWMGGIGGRVVGVVGDLTGSLTQKGKDLVGGLRSGISSAWGDIKTDVGGWISDAKNAIGDASDWTAVFKVVLDPINDITSAAGAAVSAIKSIGSWVGIGGSSKSKTPTPDPNSSSVPTTMTAPTFDGSASLGAVTTWATAVAAQFATLTPYLIFGANIGSGPATTNTVMNPPVFDGTTELTNITTWVTNVSAQMTLLDTNVGASFQELVRDANDFSVLFPAAALPAWTTAASDAKTNMTSISDAVLTGFTESQTNASNYSSLIQDTVSRSFNTIASDVDTNMSSVNDSITKWLGPDYGHKVADQESLAIANVITQQFGIAGTNVDSSMEGIYNSVTSWLGGGLAAEANNLAFGIGTAIGSGIDLGINLWAGQIATDAANLVTGAINAANAAAGNPHSPAPATIPLGSALGEGVHAGIMSWVPRVEGAMESLISVPSFSAASVSGGSSMGSDNRSFSATININGANKNPEQIADEVHTVLARKWDLYFGR